MGLPLTISDLKISGDRGRIILHVDRLSIAPGEAVGVRGPSGAGKSTLLFAVAGLLPIAGGTVRWGEVELSALSDAERAAFRRQRIGMVFQDYLLFEELTPLANAGLAGAYSKRARRKPITSRAAGMLEKLGIGLDGARSVASFSGGERQRVAVARALATDPDIVLADEPTASLDREAADRLVDDLVRLAREGGKTLISVSHDPAVHARMDRMIEVVDGGLRETVTGDA
ncbi:ABC transporter ATP-binding protein [Amorphus sp. 3PC139-8]|uniref:ABC transporter ATP-binding protein n=1 Tax=Amorphus sp. 3PC139-8 TaxID=2735676 RepID=UPI00345C8E6F